MIFSDFLLCLVYFFRVGMLSNCRTGCSESFPNDVVGCHCLMGWNYWIFFCCWLFRARSGLDQITGLWGALMYGWERPSTVGVKLSFKHCPGVGLWEGCLMGCVPDSSLTLLPLSSLTYSKDDSISFASNCYNSLCYWFVCFAILFDFIFFCLLKCYITFLRRTNYFNKVVN